MAERKQAKKVFSPQEKDFQDVANEYAHNFIEEMREQLNNEERREFITEDALEVSVREGWHTPETRQEKPEPVEYYILLGTGGPASRIVGELDEYCCPITARFEYQDWFKPWTVANTLSEKEEQTLLEYAQQFWFGE